jgi:L-fuconolactonase
VEVDAADPMLEDELIYENPSDKILARMLRVQLSPYMRVPVHATGIREPLHVEGAPRGHCFDGTFLGGLEAMAAKHMPFELCNRGEELGDMVKAFSQVPQVTVIVDHLGNISQLDDGSRKALEGMAALPHSYIKISGDNPVDPDIVKFVRDTFPPDRLLFSSNWPVVNLNSSFETHFQLMLDMFGSDEDFFKNNAIRAYNIRL